MGSMSYRKFFAYNVVGAFVWVFGIVLLGHFFGNIPYVQKNFSLVILAIVVVSMIPPAWKFSGLARRSKAKFEPVGSLRKCQGSCRLPVVSCQLPVSEYFFDAFRLLLRTDNWQLTTFARRQY